MLTRLIIARHGNTFSADEVPRRVGGHTDLPLVPSGEAQARQLGLYLKALALLPDVVYSAALQRTRQTATLALAAVGLALPVQTETLFNELDYGVDENQLESAVLARLGAALAAWETHSIVPDGWRVDVAALVTAWQSFAARLLAQAAGQTALVVTSNGVARFALTALVPDVAVASRKLATGAFGLLVHDGAAWRLSHWNERPPAV